MIADHLTAGQWWVVAGVVSALIPVAVYYCLRNLRGALYSVIAPVLGAGATLGGTRGRGHNEIEALVMYSTAVLSLVLMLVSLRGEMSRYAQRVRDDTAYEIPKWKINTCAVVVLTFAIGLMVLLLA